MTTLKGVVVSFEANHRVTDKEFWRALTSHRTCAVKTDIYKHYITIYSPLIGCVKWAIQDLTCHINITKYKHL